MITQNTGNISRPEHVWSCPMMQALESPNPPRFLVVDGRRLGLKELDGIKRYELADNQRQTKTQKHTG